ncbi:hypothetical protein X777_12777 [Ooceraea biroi]|uniref:Uncharacterized protein n=1 Tax=Ooceraea biroi TaxID=2015173 RepID=A0A026VZF0_OOCBI|nr:hypothetical protein X777_12777 [Ooceraea biroi]
MQTDESCFGQRLTGGDGFVFERGGTDRNRALPNRATWKRVHTHFDDSEI